MTSNKEDDKKQVEKRTVCVMFTFGLIALAVLILMIIVVSRFFMSSVKQSGGGNKWGARGGSCGCMAGQV